MDYFITCDCGQRIQVATCQAGEQIACKCGQTIKVPALSELRMQAGEQPIERSCHAVVVARYGKNRQLVGNGRCVCCATSTDERLVCIIECESPRLRDYPWLVQFVLTTIAIWRVICPLSNIPTRSGTKRSVKFAFPSAHRAASAACDPLVFADC